MPLLRLLLLALLLSGGYVVHAASTCTSYLSPEIREYIHFEIQNVELAKQVIPSRFWDGDRLLRHPGFMPSLFLELSDMRPTSLRIDEIPLFDLQKSKVTVMDAAMVYFGKNKAMGFTVSTPKKLFRRSKEYEVYLDYSNLRYVFELIYVNPTNHRRYPVFKAISGIETAI